MIRASVLLLLLVPLPLTAQGQEHIADNSFLIEEAYNQEAGVVQHISAFSRDEVGGSWEYGLTQEWPLGGMRHQLSYTLPVLDPEDTGAGLGDVLLHYRYQLLGDGRASLHAAPRLSVALPTGSEENGRGGGALGLQGNLPVSYVVSSALAVHSNTGFLYDAESGSVDAVLGASGVLRVRRWINVLVESVWSSADDQVVLLNPGIRWAFDLAEDFQVVPGLAYTIAVGPGASDALFVYLSLEHPFRR